jgi:hypothetical protein
MARMPSKGTAQMTMTNSFEGRLLAHEEVEEWRERVDALLAPGEQLQVVIRAIELADAASLRVVLNLQPVHRNRARYLLAATDRSWVLLQSHDENWAGPLRVVYRGDRVREIASSRVVRFEGLEHAYLIDPVIESSAHVADDALAAMQRGEVWDLADVVGQVIELPGRRRGAVSDC